MNDIQETINIVPSGYRILYVLSLLLDGKLSHNEINQKLSSHPFVAQDFTKDTLIKIINTLKASGIEISKKGNKYFVSKMPFGDNLPEKYFTVLRNLGFFVRNLGQQELTEDYENFLINLFRFLPGKKTQEFLLTKYDEKIFLKYHKFSNFIKKIEQAKKNNFKIKVNLQNESCIFDSYFIEYEQSEVFIKGYSLKEHENKKINMTEIKLIKQLPQKASGMFFPSCVTFKIKGRLVKSYNLRENEKLIEFDTDKLIVVNKGEDKKTLLRRLFKYKDLCEIIAPESFREEFVTMLKKTVSRYKNL